MLLHLILVCLSHCRIFHCTNRQVLWACGLFPDLGYYEQCCYEHSHIGFTYMFLLGTPLVGLLGRAVMLT